MKYYNEFLTDLKNVLSINSVQSTPLPNKPFGEGVYKAYSEFLKIAENMGFETHDYDGYIGEVVFGQGQEVGIIGHVDVVPEGSGWSVPPFDLTLKDGYYYGRGIADDKGPLLASLYALKELKESGVPVNKKFRLFIGTNEETGWKDVEYYQTINSFPKYGFSPDGNFPVSYAEKGVTVVKFKLNQLKNFYDIKGGIAVNAVPAIATCKATPNGINLELLKKHGLILKDDNLIESHGKASHGAQPQLGINAFSALFNYFKDMGESVDMVITNVLGDGTGIKKLQTEQGCLTFSFNLINQVKDGYELTVDCRIPAPLQTPDIIPYLDKMGLPYTAKESHPAVMVEKDGWLVNSLVSAYQEITGEKATPVSLCGSTFARVFEQGVSFGAEFEGVSNNLHDPDENISEQHLNKLYQIYKKALFNLAK